MKFSHDTEPAEMTTFAFIQFVSTYNEINSTSYIIGLQNVYWYDSLAGVSSIVSEISELQHLLV